MDHGEQSSCDAIVQPGLDFPDTITQMVNQRLTNWPCVLNREDVGADDFAILLGQLLQSVPHRLAPIVCLENDNLERAFRFHLWLVYQK